jgi:hypothetical protein
MVRNDLEARVLLGQPCGAEPELAGPIAMLKLSPED